MAFFTRLENGWIVAKTSFKVLNANKQLVIFPILSGISLLLIIGSFFTVAHTRLGVNVNGIQTTTNRELLYLIMFLFYIVNYFIVVFFNMALMHCAKLYFDGEEVSVAKGLQFSISRIGVIFSWAIFAATVGMVLKIVQENLGSIGKILISIVGFAWSIATFFVIPIIAYENLGPIDALKRSTQMMKEKWGESIGANFSIGLVAFLGIIIVAVLGTAVSAFINEGVGIGIFVVGILAILTISSALHSIFISAVYNNINGNLNDHFNQQMLDGLFVTKG